MITLQSGINRGLTNAEYHSERDHLSSSNLKMLLQSPSQFHTEKILGQKEVKTSPALELGSFVHTLVLEPDQVEVEYAMYEGWRKQGADFEAFRETNAGKVIISQPQRHNGTRLANTVKACPPALQLFTGGEAELSLATTLYGVQVKMRADYINPDAGYLVDLKTTRWPSSPDIFRRTVGELGYELSASLYCEIAYQVYGKIFDYYWAVISKTDYECQVYKASTHTLSNGSAMVSKALVTYKKCLQNNNWPDTLDLVGTVDLPDGIVEI